MIVSYADSETERIHRGKFSRAFPREIQKRALAKLIMVDNAETIGDLRMPPSNLLEKLRGDREGQYSIRVNDKYRICLRFDDGYARDVELTDYH